jgi:hypothetical protein
MLILQNFHDIYIGLFNRAGSYRDAFKAETELDSLVFKESSYSQSHEKYNYEDYHFVRKDMIVAAQLQPHPLLVETYGWCQLSLFGELAPRGDVTNAIVPRYERCNETFSSMNHHDKLIPMNDLSPSRKLEYALQMTVSEILSVFLNLSEQPKRISHLSISINFVGINRSAK